TGSPAAPITAFNPLFLAALGSYDSGSLALAGTATDQVFGGLSGFIGLGDLTFDLAAIATTTQSFSGGNLNTTQATTAGAGVTITYDYDTGNVPEPGTLSLFGTGLLGLAGMLRSRFGKAR
ncbi:MAG: choice-of-anchor E domain-containing protein, partial [Terracidiphilus sp.]